jgi:hypothetical protein
MVHDRADRCRLHEAAGLVGLEDLQGHDVHELCGLVERRGDDIGAVRADLHVLDGVIVDLWSLGWGGARGWGAGGGGGVGGEGRGEAPIVL